MVLKTLTHGEILQDIDPKAGKGCRWADAREHQQLRGRIGPRAQDHLTLGADRLHRAVPEHPHPHGTSAVEHDLVHQR